jgi:tRNA pseudouridine55 synthase
LGLSSFGLVKRVRNSIHRRVGQKVKVGHAGTLDPLATGLMVLCTGKATRKAMDLTAEDKRYEVRMKLGETTASFDLETEPVYGGSYEGIGEKEIVAVLERFKGSQLQTPPIFSAKRVNGRRAYSLARKGEEVKLSPVPVVIYSLEFISIELPYVSFRVHCSKGTYIRSLVHDLGEALGCGAYMSGLIRTASGSYSLDSAMNPDEFLDAMRKSRL